MPQIPVARRQRLPRLRVAGHVGNTKRLRCQRGVDVKDRSCRESATVGQRDRPRARDDEGTDDPFELHVENAFVHAAPDHLHAERQLCRVITDAR